MRLSLWKAQPSFRNTRPSFWGFKRKLKARAKVWKARPSVWKARPCVCVITRSMLSQSARVFGCMFGWVVATRHTRLITQICCHQKYQCLYQMSYIMGWFLQMCNLDWPKSLNTARSWNWRINRCSQNTFEIFSDTIHMLHLLRGSTYTSALLESFWCHQQDQVLFSQKFPFEY